MPADKEIKCVLPGSRQHALPPKHVRVWYVAEHVQRVRHSTSYQQSKMYSLLGLLTLTLVIFHK